MKKYWKFQPQRKYLTSIISILTGSAVLIVFSFFQKIIIGVNVGLEGFIIPLIFGGISGAVYGFWNIRLISAKEDLEKINNNLEELVSEQTALLKETNALLENEISTHKKNLEALAESEKKYRFLFDHAPDCISVIDSEGIIRECNLINTDLLGTTKNEIIGSHIIKYMSSDTKYLFDQKFPVLKKEGHLETEAELINKNGEIIPVWRKINAVYENGEFSGALVYTRDITERKKIETKLKTANERLKQLANIDGLTRLANRRSFDKRLSDEWKRQQRQKSLLSVIICDVDHFKLYNDTYGHLAGDEALKAVSAVLQKSAGRSSDLVARFGGEEFAVILPDTDINTAVSISEKIREKVHNLAIEHSKSVTDRFLSVSIGAACTVPDRESEIKSLLDTADRALYRAKKEGRNRVVSLTISQ